MKNFLLLLLFILSNLLLIAQEPGETMLVSEEPYPEQIVSQVPTDAGFPTSERILVVYADNVDSSDIVNDYYINERDIPMVNVLPLTIPNSITYPEGTVTLYNEGEDIRGEGNLGWRYVRDTIAIPIERHLNNT